MTEFIYEVDDCYSNRIKSSYSYTLELAEGLSGYKFELLTILLLF